MFVRIEYSLNIYKKFDSSLGNIGQRIQFITTDGFTKIELNYLNCHYKFKTTKRPIELTI